MKTTAGGVDLTARVQEAKARLDAHVREIIEWHFSPETGCPFWLEFASRLVWSPRKEIRCFEDLKKFPPFQDDWLRGGPVRRWVPKGLTGRPVYIFETGGTTGVPKSRVAIEDFRIDYEMFSETLPEEYFPRGANWLMLGPSGPRRLRLAVEHLCQYRGGICFCVDLDPRWVIKLIKRGRMQELEMYKAHVIGQTITLLNAGHDNNRLVDYGQTGCVRLTTLTRETFIPGFLERDEGERELPYQKYPWDGISGVRPFRQFAATTAVGVY